MKKRREKKSEEEINVCYGIEIYAQKKADEAVKKNTEQLIREKDMELKQQTLENEHKIKRTFVETAKMFGANMSETERKYVEKFGVSAIKAKKEVTMYW